MVGTEQVEMGELENRYFACIVGNESAAGVIMVNVRNFEVISGRVNTLRTRLLNCLNARSRGLTSRHSASCI